MIVCQVVSGFVVAVVVKGDVGDFVEPGVVEVMVFEGLIVEVAVTVAVEVTTAVGDGVVEVELPKSVLIF
jgi:hypothetical protein